jgi:carbamoyl-phosphate synthase large subunit
MRILLTCVGRRKYLVDYFAKEQDVSLVVGADMQMDAPGFVGCDAYEQVPSIYADDYVNSIKNICDRYSIDLVVPLNDMELAILGKARHVLEPDVRLVLSSDRVINICSDKWETYKFCLECNIPSPKTYISVETAVKDIFKGYVCYPLMVKPRWGSASFGLHKVNDESELVHYFEQCSRNLANSYLSDFGSATENVVIQEFISGEEYGVDIFNSLDCQFHSSTLKKKLSMRSGETDKARTIKNSELSNLTKQLASKLGHIGNLDCDFFELSGVFYLLEMNPRFGGGYPFSHEAGSNYVRNLLESAQGIMMTDFGYQENLVFAKCDVVISCAENYNQK